jgi:hypothetical protein
VRPAVAWRSILPFAGAVLAVLVLTGNRYGYHRDELYFRAAARHPALGYDDQPALTPLLGRLSELVFGETPRGVRVVSAVAAALVVILVGLIARELGGGRRAQLIAAASTASTGGVLAAGHLLSTETFDVLAWVTVVWLVTRQLLGADEREWLLAGVATGVALENKHLILLLLASLGVGLVLGGRARLLLSPWLWAGVVVATVVWLPNLIWQGTHGWPQLELARKIADEDPVANRVGLVPFLLLVVGLLLAPVAVAGLTSLLRRPDVRPLGVAFLAVLVLCLVIGAKPYYPAPFALALLGAGAVRAERWRRQSVLGAAIAVNAALSVVIALPLVPVGDLHATPIPAVNEDAIETVGWPRFVRTVGRVAPPGAVVFTGSYGEAGAVDRYGSAYGLDRAYSGHNAYARFGRPDGSTGPVVVLGFDDPSRWFAGCRRAARIDNGVDVDNEEQGGIVWVCRAPARPWRELWPELTHLSP